MIYLANRFALPRPGAALAVAFILSMTPVVSSAADWPRWQGPDRNAVSKETGLL